MRGFCAGKQVAEAGLLVQALDELLPTLFCLLLVPHLIHVPAGNRQQLASTEAGNVHQG